MKLSEKIIRIIASLIFTLFILSLIIFFGRFYFALNSIKKLDSIKDFECVHLVVYGSSQNSMSASIKLLDENQNIFAEFERSWPSSSIYFEFVTFSYENKHISFPNRIYSSNSLNIQSGIHLGKYIVKQNSKNKFLKSIAKFAVKPSSRTFSKYIKYNQISLSACIPGIEYVIIEKSDGNIVLKEFDEL